MASTTYKAILKDQIIGNGLAPLYGWGSSFQRGDTQRDSFLAFLVEQQKYFTRVVSHTLAGDMGQVGSITEAEGIGLRQFQHLGDILHDADWRNRPHDIEQFVQEVLRLKGEEYQQPEWLKMLLS